MCRYVQLNDVYPPVQCTIHMKYIAWRVKREQPSSNYPLGIQFKLQLQMDKISLVLLN